jgi:hypothetical protein
MYAPVVRRAVRAPTAAVPGMIVKQLWMSSRRAGVRQLVIPAVFTA